MRRLPATLAYEVAAVRLNTPVHLNQRCWTRAGQIAGIWGQGYRLSRNSGTEAAQGQTVRRNCQRSQGLSQVFLLGVIGCRSWRYLLLSRWLLCGTWEAKAIASEEDDVHELQEIWQNQGCWVISNCGVLSLGDMKCYKLKFLNADWRLTYSGWAQASWKMALRINSRQWKISAHSGNKRWCLINTYLSAVTNSTFQVAVIVASTLLLW